MADDRALQTYDRDAPARIAALLAERAGITTRGYKRTSRQKQYYSILIPLTFPIQPTILYYSEIDSVLERFF